MRLPGCNERCYEGKLVSRMTGLIVEGTIHDPLAHEEWASAATQNLHKLGQLTIDITTRRITHTIQGDVKMSATEYNMLMYLLKKTGSLCTHNELLNYVWGEAWVGDLHLLRVNMCRIRTQLGCAGFAIVTKIGVGYMILPEEAKTCNEECTCITNMYYRKAQGKGISLRQRKILDALNTGSAARMSSRDISMLTGVHRGSISSAVESLRRRGYPIQSWHSNQGGGYQLASKAGS